MKKFIEFRERTYDHCGFYTLNKIFVSLDDISRVSEHVDKYTCPQLITVDGERHILHEEYVDVINKIRKCIEE